MTASAPSQFRSNYKAMVITARHGHDILHPVTGTKVDEVKRLSAEFGVHRGEYDAVDAEGGVVGRFADIAGFFYDLDVDAAAKGWSADEKEAMRAHLIKKAETNPDFCQIHEPPVIAAPWPTYDSMHHNKIPVFAVDSGLVHEALAYERANKARQGVVADLEKLIAPAAQGTPEPVEELTAV